MCYPCEQWWKNSVHNSIKHLFQLNITGFMHTVKSLISYEMHGYSGFTLNFEIAVEATSTIILARPSDHMSVSVALLGCRKTDAAFTFDDNQCIYMTN